MRFDNKQTDPLMRLFRSIEIFLLSFLFLSFVRSLPLSPQRDYRYKKTQSENDNDMGKIV